MNRGEASYWRSLLRHRTRSSCATVTRRLATRCEGLRAGVSVLAW